MSIPTRCFLIKSFTPYASLEAMQTDIGFDLRRRHMAVSEHLHSNFPNFELFKRQFAQVSKHDGRRFVVDTNINHNYRTDGRSLYDVWSLPRFSFLTDNPVHKLDLLREFPDWGIVGVVDYDFIDLLKNFEVPGRGIIPFPHGGPDPLPDQRISKERDIDVLVVGNVSSSLSRDDWLRQCGGTDPLLRGALAKILDRSLNGDEGLWAIVGSEFQAAGIDADPDRVAAIVRDTETQIIAQRRRDILTSMRRHKVVFYGAVEEGVTLPVSDNVSVNDILPYQDVLDLMMRTKIVVNISPSFRNGAHERVFYGLSRGATILAEPTRFLSREASEDLGVAFLPYASEDTDDAISAILDRSDMESDSVREKALEHYARTHTWTQRVDGMVQAMETAFWSDG